MRASQQIARIDERHAVVVVILRRPQADGDLLQPAVAHRQMELRAVGYVAFGPANRLRKQFARLFELARVKQLHARFEAGELTGSAIGPDWR